MQRTFGDKTIDFTRIPDIGEEDIAFLSDMFRRFPRVLAGYHEFTLLPPDHRVPAAAKTLDNQPRRGWELRFEELPHIAREVYSIFANEYYEPRWLIWEKSGAPAKETVLEHCAEAQELFRIVYYGSASSNHLQWGMECMKFHDFHEAIDGDFTPHCTITRAEKKRLEKISTELLCEARHTGNIHTMHVYNCTQIFEGHAAPKGGLREEMLSAIRAKQASGQVLPHQEQAVSFFDSLYTKSIPFPDLKALQPQLTDIDALHMTVRSCRMVKEGHIKPEHTAKMDEFWNYVSQKLQTPQAKAFFKALQESYLEHADSYETALQKAAEAAASPSR